MKFEVGQKVRIKDDAKKIQHGNWAWDGAMDDLPGTIGEIAKNDVFGNYRVITNSPKYGKGSWFFSEKALEPYTEPKPKTEIAYFGMNNQIKVVFNPPYTIIIGQISGRKAIAKCHPSDTYDKWIGFKTAYERYECPWIMK